MPGNNRNSSRGGQGQPQQRQRNQNRGDNRDQSGGNQQTTPLRAIHAPYNFVPLPEHIFIPEWAKEGKWKENSHDKPFEDGLCGELSLQITAHSPILIGNEQVKDSAPGEVHFCKEPGKGGRYFIPGSSVRGMIRNVLEIAAFGRMRFVEDQRMSIRDLAGPAKEVYRKNIIGKSKAGWLRHCNEGWAITPCTYVHVSHRLLEQYHGNGLTLGMRGSAKNKYEQWKKSVGVGFDVENLGNNREIAMNLHPGSKGKLVFSGQPGPSKKSDFIFYGDSNESLPISPRDMKDFFRIHDSEDDDNTWNCWKELAEKGERVPVFYIPYGERIAIGMAEMFRLPYSHSIHQIVDSSKTSHLADVGDDIPALVFGYIDDDKGLNNLKARAWFTPAFADENDGPEKNGPTILASPKPSYYPIYIEQAPKQGQPGKLAEESYYTYMDDEAKIRGFKRYPARPEKMVDVKEVAQDQRRNAKIQVILHPLLQNTSFGCKLKFHNLKPEELGALVWALKWGGRDKLKHSLGMGRPFGFGQVAVKITSATITANNGSSTLEPEEYQAKFVKLMDGWCQTQLGKVPWVKTDQMIQLLAMADPGKAPGQPGSLEYMKLSQFVEAKNKRMILADYVKNRATRVKLKKSSQQGEKSGQGSNIQGRTRHGQRQTPDNPALAGALGREIMARVKGNK